MSILAATKRRLACAGWVALLAAALPCSTTHAQDAFYQATAAEIEDGAPGSIIREEPMRATPPGGIAHRVLYRSTSPEGKKIAVSGVIITPPGAPPQGGWPVVAWAHPTTGIVPRCAPSLAIFVYQQIAGSRPLTEKGYAIAATDYPGLGTPGPHPYLVGVSEARAVIDSVRAARTFPGVNGSRYAVWGHSQGGQAALFTGMISEGYAPELTLVGVAAAAPATELAILMTDDLHSTGGRNLTAMTVWSWSRIYDARADSIVAPVAMPIVDLLAEECIESPFDILERGRTAAPLAKEFLIVKNPAEVEPWRSLLERNTPGPLPPTLPVFLAQGTSDGLVRPEVTEDYTKRLCGAGSRVQMLLLPGVSHGLAAAKSADAAVAWMADRFAGKAAPNDCGG
jgi:acetyl esterase/lipase